MAIALTSLGGELGPAASSGVADWARTGRAAVMAAAASVPDSRRSRRISVMANYSRIAKGVLQNSRRADEVNCRFNRSWCRDKALQNLCFSPTFDNVVTTVGPTTYGLISESRHIFDLPERPPVAWRDRRQRFAQPTCRRRLGSRSVWPARGGERGHDVVDG